MSRRERIARRLNRSSVHRKNEVYLKRPKTLTPPKRMFSHVAIADHDRSMLESIGSGSVADGIEILCEAFRGGLRYLQDGRRKKP